MKSVTRIVPHRIDGCGRFPLMALLVTICLVGLGCQEHTTKPALAMDKIRTVPQSIEAVKSPASAGSSDGTIEWRGVDSQFSHSTNGK